MKFFKKISPCFLNHSRFRAKRTSLRLFPLPRRSSSPAATPSAVASDYRLTPSPSCTSLVSSVAAFIHQGLSDCQWPYGLDRTSYDLIDLSLIGIPLEDSNIPHWFSGPFPRSSISTPSCRHNRLSSTTSHVPMAIFGNTQV